MMAIGVGLAARKGIAAVALAGVVALTGCSMSTAAKTRETDIRAREYVARAEQLTEEGMLDEAITQLELAIEENATLTTAHVDLGDIYRVQGNYQAAEQSYRRATELEPRNFEAQYGHGLVLQLLDRLSDAVRAYLRALSIDPNNFNANLNLATAYLQLQESRQALPYARKAVEVDPRNGPARVNLGAIYAAVGEYESAIREYQAAAELMDFTPPLLLNLADSLGKTGRYQEMVNTLGQLLRMAPTAQAYERLGFALFRLQRFEEAQDAFARAVELDNAHFPALNGLGVCLLNRYLMSDRTDSEARREGVAALRKSLIVNRDQPRIADLVSRYG